MIMCRKILLLAIAALSLACDRASHREERGGTDSVAVPKQATAAADAVGAVLFLGTSLTAGLGLSADQAYPALIQQKIDSAGFSFRAVNAGVSGETSAGGVRRIDWLLRQPVAVLVLELGANDGLRGQDIAALEANLQTIIDRTRAAHAHARIVIAGMEAPPNLGGRYTDAFRQVYVDLARRNRVALLPFLLNGVAGRPELNQADGIHPTAKGQEIMAENVWRVLEPILEELRRHAASPAMRLGEWATRRLASYRHATFLGGVLRIDTSEPPLTSVKL